jgi:predicted dehydrogenase
MGERGVINLDLMQQGLSICSDRYTYPAFSHGVAGELAHFLACAEGTETPRITPSEARSALELSLAAIRSSKSGRAVTLPL